jgi:hypothetical protein
MPMGRVCAGGRVEQYHTHTRIVDGYKLQPIPVPVGYPAGR